MVSSLSPGRLFGSCGSRGPGARHPAGVGCVLVNCSRFNVADKVCRSHSKVTQSPRRASEGGRVGNPTRPGEVPWGFLPGPPGMPGFLSNFSGCSKDPVTQAELRHTGFHFRSPPGSVSWRELCCVSPALIWVLLSPAPRAHPRPPGLPLPPDVFCSCCRKAQTEPLLPHLGE